MKRDGYLCPKKPLNFLVLMKRNLFFALSLALASTSLTAKPHVSATPAETNINGKMAGEHVAAPDRESGPRRTLSLNRGWKFSRDSLFTDFTLVDIPHDFQIEQPWVEPTADERPDRTDMAANVVSRLSSRGFKEMGTGWYQRTFAVPDSVRGRRVLLDVEGIMLVGDVWLNGTYIGGTDYGYLGFESVITEQLRYGQDNVLTVKTSTMGERNSRWYTGGGLFRDINLVSTPSDLYFERHPLFITTREGRFVDVQAEFTWGKGTRREAVTLSLTLFAPDGTVVYEHTDTVKTRTPARTIEAHLSTASVPDALLWDTESPNLYKAVVVMRRPDGSVADVAEEAFGIRTVVISPDSGLTLNGKKVLLKGCANHHTLGPLGAAAYPRDMERLILQLKAFGINHIRTSHNPYSRHFIELCDQYGILVVDELYDKWNRQYAGGRSPWENHWQQDVVEWVKRDRNSPSVVMWSLGNELQQDASQAYNDFGVTAYRLQKTLLHRYDSTRAVTVAMHPRYRNWETDSLPCALAMETDVQAYNYRYMYFPGDGRRFPWMTFYQSEASTSAMGDNFFGMDLDKVIGLAYWGAVDYLGESQGWPLKGWTQGVFDITMEPKPKAYLMKSLFCDEPVVHIAVEAEAGGDLMWNGVQIAGGLLSEQWTWPKGTKVRVRAFTNADEVELLLNGRSLGTKQNPAEASHRNRLSWDGVPYEAGKLEAVARRDGKIVARHAIETVGKAVRLKVEPENGDWRADGQDLQHIRVTAVDAKGRRVLMAQDSLHFEIVQGDARVVAVANGDMSSNELYTADCRRLWQGSALVILRAGTLPSDVVLRISSDAYKTVTTHLPTR